MTRTVDDIDLDLALVSALPHRRQTDRRARMDDADRLLDERLAATGQGQAAAPTPQRVIRPAQPPTRATL